MTITIDATYEDGVLKPAQPLALREHETVRVTVHSLADQAAESHAGTIASDNAQPSLAERIVARARVLPPGALDSLPEDLAAQHDHYLYGTPKSSE